MEKRYPTGMIVSELHTKIDGVGLPFLSWILYAFGGDFVNSNFNACTLAEARSQGH